MLKLNLPTYDFRIQKSSDNLQIFDVWRCRWVALTPEEWVRQNVLTFLEKEKGYPHGRIAVETAIEVNGCKKRCDAVIFSPNAKPLMIIEFKRPDVSLSQKVFDQVAVYNTRLNVDHFLISNGFEHYACRIDHDQNRYLFYPEIPPYSTLGSAHH